MYQEGATATNPKTGEKVVLRGGQWVPQGAQQQPSAPVFVPGVKQVDPNEQTRLDLAKRADARAEADQQRQDRMAPVQEQNARLELENKGKPQESERTAGFLATNLAGAFTDLERVATANPDARSPSIGAKIAGVFGPVAENFANSPARQQVEAAQLTILDSALTLGTGAAYNKEQLEGYRQSYFPQLGDAPETVDFKRQQLRRLLEAAKIKAGKAAPMIDEVIGRLSQTGNAGLSPDQYDAQLGRMIREGRSTEEIAKFAKDSGYNIDPAAVEQARGKNVNVQHDKPSVLEDMGRSFMTGLGGVVQGVGDVVGIAANPVNEVLNWTGLPQAITGQPLSTDVGRTLKESLGFPEPRNNTERLGVAVNRGGASALTGSALAGAVAKSRPILELLPGGGPSGGAPNALARFAAAPATDTAAGAAAAGGGEKARQSGAGPVGQIAAGLGAGGLVAGGAGVLNSLQRGPATSVLGAAERQGVDLLPADVGGPTTRRLTAAAAQGPISAAPVIKRATNAVDQMGQAANRAATRVGEILPEDEAGAGVRRAAELFSKQSSQRGSRLYDRARDMAGDAKIEPSGALAEIDAQIARLNETPEVNAPLISELEKFKASLQRPGGISVSGLRDVRSIASKAAYTEALRSTPAKAVLGKIADTLSNDIGNGLAASGKENAAKAFRTADAYWRERVQKIDEVLEPIVGAGKSGEDALRAFEAMARGKKGGVSRLSQMMRLLPEEEAGDIQATIVDRLGKANAGQQNADGSAFSASTFLTNWNSMSSKGKSALFPDPQLRKNLDDIAMIADNTRQSQRYSNFSNTAGGIAGQMMLSGGVGAIGGFKGLILATAAQYLSGKALTSKALTSWLAHAPARPTASYLDRLAIIASREPAIAGDAKMLQDRLNQAFGEVPGRAAASGSTPNQQNDDTRPRVPQ